MADKTPHVYATYEDYVCDKRARWLERPGHHDDDCVAFEKLTVHRAIASPRDRWVRDLRRRAGVAVLACWITCVVAVWLTAVVGIAGSVSRMVDTARTRTINCDAPETQFEVDVCAIVALTLETP